jgi:hypothetical protein
VTRQSCGMIGVHYTRAWQFGRSILSRLLAHVVTSSKLTEADAIALETAERCKQMERQDRAFIAQLQAAILRGLETPAGVQELGGIRALVIWYEPSRIFPDSVSGEEGHTFVCTFSVAGAKHLLKKRAFMASRGLGFCCQNGTTLKPLRPRTRSRLC